MSDGQFEFDWGSGARPPRAAALADRLTGLAERGIYLGTSSWKYPGWLGQVYEPARYHSGNRFSQKKFERECLAEYATVFPTVCGDFAFYRFPSAALWERTFAQVPGGFRFSLKVPEEVTAHYNAQWAIHTRDWTYLFNLDGRPHELYHRATDLQEQNNVLEDHRQVANMLELTLRRFADEIERKL